MKQKVEHVHCWMCVGFTCIEWVGDKQWVFEPVEWWEWIKCDHVDHWIATGLMKGCKTWRQSWRLHRQWFTMCMKSHAELCLIGSGDTNEISGNVRMWMMKLTWKWMTCGAKHEVPCGMNKGAHWDWPCWQGMVPVSHWKSQFSKEWMVEVSATGQQSVTRQLI